MAGVEPPRVKREPNPSQGWDSLIRLVPSCIGGEQRRNQEFQFRFRQCRYRNFWQEKTGKFVNLWIDFREDIFPVYFYSESESYSLKSIQRITNSLAFSCQKFRYRHCRNRNRNSWFLLCSPPTWDQKNCDQLLCMCSSFFLLRSFGSLLRSLILRPNSFQPETQKLIINGCALHTPHCTVVHHTMCNCAFLQCTKTTRCAGEMASTRPQDARRSRYNSGNLDSLPQGDKVSKY